MLKKLTKKTIILLMLVEFSISSLTGYTQQYPQDKLVSLPSPNAMSLGVFSEFPTAMPTGNPEINVPVYNVNCQGLSIPLSLTYNVNLLKPDAHNGWVGLGWNLTTGGSITRTVNDKPDDCDIFEANVYNRLKRVGSNERPINVGYYYNYNFFNSSDWSSASKIQTATADMTNNYYTQNYAFFAIPQTIFDYQPDEFSFSFLGISGNFYLDENRNWKVRCNQKIKVDFDSNDRLSFEGNWSNDIQHSGFGKFTITDTKGIRYIFGGSTSAIEYSSSLLPLEISPVIPKTWNLTKIILPDGDIVSFTYKRGEPIMQAVMDRNGTSDASILDFNTVAGSVIFPSYLTNIKTPLQEIIFSSSVSNDLQYDHNAFNNDEVHWYRNYDRWIQQSMQNYNPNYALNLFFNFSFLKYFPLTSDNTRSFKHINYYKLDKISVFDKITNNEKMNFSFTYTENPNERLKLSAIAKGSLMSSNKEDEYYFDYNNAFKLPAYLSDMTDFWGYYNGTHADNTSHNGYMVSKLPNPNYMQAEVLTKITYPTKGYTTFLYEPHFFSKELDFDRSKPLISVQPETMAGGLRIREIDHYDIDNNKINWKKYFYVKDYIPETAGLLSSGILGGVYSNTSKYGAGFLTRLLPAANNNNGSHIGYSEVAEQFSNGSYRISYFSNFDNGTNNEYMDEPPANILYATHVPTLQTTIGVPANVLDFTSNAFIRGYLLKQKDFNSNRQLLNEHIITYTGLNKSNEYVRNITTEYGIYVANSQLMYDYAGTAYKTYTYPYVPLQEQMINYQNPQSIPIKKVVDYVYDPLTLNLLNVNTSNSRDQSSQTIFRYPLDMVNAARDFGGVYASMVANNNIGAVVETVDNLDGNQIKLARTDYKFFPGIVKAKPWRNTAKFGNADEKVLSSNNSYDDRGNLTSISKDGGPTTSLLWGYNKSRQVARVVNATINEIYYNNMEENTDFPIGGVIQDVNKAHSGWYSGRIDNGGSGEVVYHSNTTLQISNSTSKMYHYSGWVYSDGPSVDLFLFMKRSGEGGYYSYVDATSTGQTGKWVYLSKDFLVPADVTQLNLRVDNNGSTNGQTQSVWFDDLRICPSDADMSTYTYEPSVGMTSTTDNKGKTTTYEYDNFQRLYRVKNFNGEVVEQYCYNSVGQQTDCSVPIAQQRPSPTPVYARVEVGNVTYVYNGNDPYQSVGNQDEHADVYIRFYSDAACTTPYVLTSNIDVDMQHLYDFGDQNGSGQYTYINTYTATAGVGEVYIGNLTVSSNSSYNDPYYGYVNSRYSFVYTLVGRVGSNYHSEDTYGFY